MAKRVQLPDGSIGEFPDNMEDSAIEGVLQKQYPADMRPPAPSAPQVKMESSSIPGALLGAGEVAKGAAKGFAHTLGEAGKYGPTSSYASAINMAHPEGPTPATPAKVPDVYNTPSNTAQKVGYTGEQIGEFFVPGGAEAEFGKLSNPLLRIGESAAEGAVRNKLQGGDLSTGAIAGGVGGAVNQGLQAAAPSLAESALGITRRMRGYGKTPGEAVLNEIQGIRPSTIFQNATAKTGELNNQVEGMAAAHPLRLSIGPAVQDVDSAIGKAAQQNNETSIKQLGNVKKALTVDVNSGLPLSPNQSASKVLDLKRGLRNQFITNWNPETMSGTRAVAAGASHTLDSTLDSALGPDFASANQRLSSLIPVADRAASEARGPGITQSVMHRVGAHTGAALGSVAAGTYGYHKDGIPGMVQYGLGGLILPEIAASPAGQMAAARAINSPVLPKLMVGSGLQLDRKKNGNNDEGDQ